MCKHCTTYYITCVRKMYYIDGCMTDTATVNALFILDMQVCIILYTYAFQELLEYDPRNGYFIGC